MYYISKGAERTLGSDNGVAGEVTVGGTRLETLTFPSRIDDRPAIVMLHEGLGSVALWKDFPRLVADRTGCGVFVYSRLGHGGSDQLKEKRPVEYMHHEARGGLAAG